MPGEFRLYGFDEFQQRIKSLENLDKAAEHALKAGAQIVLEKVKPKIPRSNLSKEHAADHIVISGIKHSKGVPYVVIGPEKGDSGPYFYLKFYEFGTSNPNALGMVIPALHMFGSTVAEQKEAVKAAMVEAIKKELGL